MKLPLQKSRLNKKLLNLNLGTCLVMIEIARSAAVITDVACESNKGSSRIGAEQIGISASSCERIQ